VQHLRENENGSLITNIPAPKRTAKRTKVSLLFMFVILPGECLGAPQIHLIDPMFVIAHHFQNFGGSLV